MPEGGFPDEPSSAWWNPKKDIQSSIHMITGSWLNLLLLLIPFAFVSEFMHWSATTVFLLVSLAVLKQKHGHAVIRSTTDVARPVCSVQQQRQQQLMW